MTATNELFVLAHFGIPHVEPQRWTLVVDGLVKRKAAFQLAELMAHPKVIVESVHECAGNPLQPKLATRRVANVRWGGVDLVALLEKLGVEPSAQFIWSYGLDGGTFVETQCNWYCKDLPLSRLAAGGVILAYELNGEPLSATHGFPLRLVVPGYYGTNSVKWLWRLRLARQRANGPFTTLFYNDKIADVDLATGNPQLKPAWSLAPESIIVAPAAGAVLTCGEPTEIWGWAWSFHEISAVEISTDDGANFCRATLEARRGWAWQRFSLNWRPLGAGDARVSVRAMQADGIGQPAAGARNAMHSVTVSVR
ncbi:MAG TPA: molybdopterin-dependent oxidoreductase [Xanthobacteraceae bacterium]